MILAKDCKVTMYIGRAFKGTWYFKNADGTPTDLSSITSATAELRNIDSEFSEDPSYSVGTVVIEAGAEVGRVDVNLSALDTANLKIPADENAPYTVSGVYSKVLVEDQDGVPFLDLEVTPKKV